MYHEFFMTRKIRMICPPKSNAPIINRYKDETLERKYRIASIPPTEQLVFMLDRFDKQFIQKEFPSKVRNIRSNQSNFHLWLKIIHVEIISHITTSASINREEKAKLNRTDIYLVDMSSDNQAVILSLYDSQSSLTPIFKRNDYVGLHNPLIHPPRADTQEPVFEYSNETVIFLMPEKEAQEAGLAKINLTSMIEDDEYSYSDRSKKDILERDEEVKLVL